MADHLRDAEDCVGRVEPEPVACLWVPATLARLLTVRSRPRDRIFRHGERGSTTAALQEDARAEGFTVGWAAGGWATGGGTAVGRPSASTSCCQEEEEEEG